MKSIFRSDIGESPNFVWLPKDQLVEVLAGDAMDARDVFIGGAIDMEFRLLTLVRGNREFITVPLSVFHPLGNNTPDFTRFELDDFGHSVRFGEYEAAADFILYGADAEFRKRAKKKRRAEEIGFGPSLRRLRALRKIPQSGFRGISAKTIARVENGEVDKPHGCTLKTISETLGVAVGEIESY